MKLYLLSLACLPLLAQPALIDSAKIRAHVRFLASDLLEGRGVGTRGGDLATEYLASQFALVGAKPAGDNGTYFQKVPLVNVAVDPSSALAFSVEKKSLPLRWLEGFVGTTFQQQPVANIDTEAVFVGHGITAPEFKWNDYEGVDVRNKTVVLFTNEPPSEDPNFFGGKALTYYGRWTYKFEQAARMGAAACIIIHTTPTAGYGWQVVRGSWGREEPQVRRDPSQHALAFAGWITQDAAQQVLGLTSKNVDDLLKLADTRGFKAFTLGTRMRARISARLRPIESRNVVARVEGSDAARSQEAVLFSAHWDHLGIGEAVNGDAIYNGAVDNATGLGMLLEIARAWAAMPSKPRRSALFVAVTGEESGLLGSKYYAENPAIPLGLTAANLNFDAYYPFGRTRDVVLNGAERTTLWPLVQNVAKRFKFEIKPDPRPEQGSYYRSDHFSLARLGVPSFSINLGDQFEGKPAEAGAAIFREFNTKHYHQPSDEYKEDWDFSGMEHAARFGFVLGMEIANQNALPTWNEGDEFLAEREKRLKSDAPAGSSATSPAKTPARKKAPAKKK